MLKRREFLTSAPLGVTSGWILWQTDLVQKSRRPRVGSSKEDVTHDQGATGSVSVGSDTVRILHLCDNHLGGETRQGSLAPSDERTISDWHRHTERHRPDLVVINGDLWHDNPRPGSGLRLLERASRELSSLGVPWAFTWGNHDELDDYDEGHHLLETAPGSLYRGRRTHGNYRVEVRRSGGPSRPPGLSLFFLNTDDRGLTAVPLSRATQFAAAAPAPGVAFFHIPIREYDSLYQPGLSQGVRLQGVGHARSANDALDVLSRGGIRACFCGHDHLNDYSVRKGSLALHYGRATGHAGYGGGQLRKGAKLIEMNLAGGSYTVTTVFADGTREQPIREAPA